MSPDSGAAQKPARWSPRWQRYSKVAASGSFSPLGEDAGSSEVEGSIEDHRGLINGWTDQEEGFLMLLGDRGISRLTHVGAFCGFPGEAFNRRPILIISGYCSS